MDIINLITVKADTSSEEWALNVLGVPYGGPDNGRDGDGEYFDSRTLLHEDKFPTPPAVYYHGWQPDGRPASAPEYIGKTVGFQDNEQGRWYRVILNKTSELARRVWEAAKKGLAYASSGSNHLARVDDDGHIREWPVVELSLLDVGEQRAPVNRYAIALPAAKAVYEQAGLTWPEEDDGDTGSQVDGEGATAQSPETETEEAVTSDEPSQQELKTMSDDMLTLEDVRAAAVEAAEAAVKAEREAVEAARQAEADKQAEIEEAVKAERAKWEEEAAKARRLPFDGNNAPHVAQFGELRRYDNLDAGQAALAAGLARAFNGHVSAPLLKAAAVKTLEDMESPYERPDPVTGRINDPRQALKARGLVDVDAAAKANEAMYSTSTGYGLEWITTGYSNALWRKIRVGNPVLEKMNQYAVEVPQGSNTLEFKLEAGDPTWYTVAEAVATTADGPDATITTSRVGTGNKSLTVKKLGARVAYSGEEEEDSIIPLVPQIMDQLTVSGSDYLTSAILDGDSAATASTNINDIGGTSAAADWFMVMNGMCKLALVTNTANHRHGGALSVDDYLETLYLMGTGGKNAYGAMNSISFVQGPAVNKMALRLAEVKTKDVYSNPTVERGLLTSLWGYDIITSFNLHRASLVNTGYEYKTDSAGKVNIDTPSNCTYGALLAVRWDQWRLGYKRRIKLEKARWPYADLDEIVATMRVGLAYRDTDASAMSIQLTV